MVEKAVHVKQGDLSANEMPGVHAQGAEEPDGADRSQSGHKSDEAP